MQSLLKILTRSTLISDVPKWMSKNSANSSKIKLCLGLTEKVESTKFFSLTRNDHLIHTAKAIYDKVNSIRDLDEYILTEKEMEQFKKIVIKYKDNSEVKNICENIDEFLENIELIQSELKIFKISERELNEIEHKNLFAIALSCKKLKDFLRGREKNQSWTYSDKRGLALLLSTIILFPIVEYSHSRTQEELENIKTSIPDIKNQCKINIQKALEVKKKSMDLLEKFKEQRLNFQNNEDKINIILAEMSK